MEDPNSHILQHRSELTWETKELLSIAEHTTDQAYAPYSGLSVGAALRLNSGKIITGSNFENAAFPLCLCAERVALASAHSQFPDVTISAMAITWKYKVAEQKGLLLPCGACRQVIHEAQQKQESPIQLIIDAKYDKVLLIKDISEILPTGFSGGFLKL